MVQKEAIKIFQEKKVRTIWDSEAEKWYFSIVDVVSVLTDSADGRKYWNKLKQRLKEEGNETVTNCHQLKMRAADGKRRGLKEGIQFATLTDIITQAWSGMTTKEYKDFKGLKKENLRDNMSNIELILNMLAEATTSEISKEKKPATFVESKVIAQQGGQVAGNARKEIESRTGKDVVTPLNAKDYLEPDKQSGKEIQEE